MKRLLLIPTLFIACLALPAMAEEETPRAVGVTVDLLPTVMSATTGHAGGSLQVWGGIDHWRLRAVGAHMHMPNWLAAAHGFKDQETTVLAGIVDYTFGPRFDGWWVGTGFEAWMNTIGHSHAGHQRVAWFNPVYTVGGGYIWMITHGFYVEPWAAGHVLMARPRVSLVGDTYRSFTITGEASLKIGYAFSL